MLLGTLSNPLGEKYILRKFCLIIISLVLVSIHVQAQSGAWTRKTDMPTGRGLISASVVSDKIYVIGGMGAPPLFEPLAANEVYDPKTNTWQNKRDLPTSRSFVSTAAVDGIVYVIGGGFPDRDTSSAVDAYDPVTDTWTSKANMFSPRFGASACVLNGIIYNVGGNHFENNCEAFDPKTNTWTKKADIPETQGGIMTIAYNGLIYAFGGGFNISFSTVYAYDPKTDTWTKKNNMPTPRATLQVCLVLGKIYALGGYKSISGEVVSALEVYDPVSDSWEKKTDMPFKRTMFGGAVVNGKIYVIGGTSDWSGTNGQEVWEYDPAYVIPVDLTTFTASANEKEVKLNWTTATELNNQGFEVQRKFGSNDFVTIGSVKGHGTTTSPNNYTYVDKLTDAGKYFYRLKQIDFGGKYEYSQTAEINWSPFTTYTLEQNYPNPFNPTTTIGFGILASPNPSKGGALVTLKIYDVLGNEVKILINEEKEAGYHLVDFNASELPSGVYFCRIQSGNFIDTKKMILLK
jgi:N-acetylneuraminic acid mutarotase